MTCIGWDGTGYQAGLASSSEPVTWRRLGCIFRRDPSNLITRYPNEIRGISVARSRPWT